MIGGSAIPNRSGRRTIRAQAALRHRHPEEGNAKREQKQIP
ncbi:MAG: hypothetical protein HSCHL_2327 [Hydrogenibacillus schlegelii]|uniref:Uncharacterized protein n=1 Tax=Hydrogenibacillus schlegelii TaxID=1484 RepID=A0A2T5GEX3_HYDSH|nr:MAG: hypothetical protein HSCHL_2327 [Hydrogenibacillus schlegelii]